MDLSPNYKKRWEKFKNEFTYVLKTFLPFYETQLCMMSGTRSLLPNILLHGVHGFPLDLLWKEGLKRHFEIDNFIEKECLWEKNMPYLETSYYMCIDMANPYMPNDPDILHNLKNNRSE